MKRLAIILLALSACRTAAGGASGTAGVQTGAATARAAVEGFLGAVNAQDLQAMSVMWGTSKGPIRDAVARDELEKRELIMQCYLGSDQFRILGSTTTSAESQQFQVSLTKGNLTRETTFVTVRGPGSRWYVERADLEPVKDFCRPVAPG